MCKWTALDAGGLQYSGHSLRHDGVMQYQRVRYLARAGFALALQSFCTFLASPRPSEPANHNLRRNRCQLYAVSAERETGGEQDVQTAISQVVAGSSCRTLDICARACAFIG